ncbi:MAG: IS1634 family transposase [Chloroflexi bacterium]|nr:IS1634 family transposase [Chloroflexota bacterium]
MDLHRIVGSCLGTPRHHVLDHARTLSVLLHNILLSPGPLYRIAEWAQPLDPAALGLTPDESEALNDDRVARTLDALASVRSRSLFFRLALHLIKDFELDTTRIHQDTTTITFCGAYEGQTRSPRITRGINKDHRPDLKQLVFGVSVTADGAVPLVHEVYSGNRTDDTVHRGNLARLRTVLQRSDFIYVADSKLCTKKNLGDIARHHGFFVTLMPRTWKEEKLLRERLREGPVRWRKFLEVPNHRRKSDPPNIYSTTAEEPKKTLDDYRIVWIRSSQKALRDEEVRSHQIEKAEDKLVGLGFRLNQRKLKQRGAIRKAVRTILEQCDCKTLLKVVIRQETQTRLRRTRPGRPRLDDPVVEERHRIFRLEVERDEEALAEERRTDGVFGLVTNLPEKRGPKKEILEIYKYQPYVEKRHALLKSELEVAPVYLKKPQRVVGMIHAHFLAMVLEALIERTIRRAMQMEQIKALPILPEGRMSKTPTTPRVLEAFSGLSWYEFERGKETVTFPVRLTALQKKLLRLLGIDPGVYD